jgi:hypothetical protein
MRYSPFPLRNRVWERDSRYHVWPNGKKQPLKHPKEMYKEDTDVKQNQEKEQKEELKVKAVGRAL